MSIPWYWICLGDSEKHSGFSCEVATRSYFKAKCTILWRNRKEKDGVWYIKERPEHPDSDFKQFQCPDCGNLMSSRELDHTWDCAGPHCNKCGCTGMDMFSSVTTHAPVVSGRALLNVLEKFTKGEGK